MGAVLVLTNSADATADHLEHAALLRGVEWHRVNTDAVEPIVVTLTGSGPGRLSLSTGSLSADQVSGVWYRRPKAVELTGAGSEGERRHAGNEWAAAIDTWLSAVPWERWINAPPANVRAGKKLEQLWQATSVGLRTPPTLVTNRPEDAREFVSSVGTGVVVKPLSWGTVSNADEDEGLIYTSRLTEEDERTLGLVSACPTLFQAEIEGRVLDVRVTWIDGEAIAVGLTRGDNEVDIRYRNMEAVQYQHVEVPEDVQSRLSQLLRHYSLRFAAVDFIVDMNGAWFFLEVNPNGQWAWLEEALGFQTISDRLLRALGAHW